MSITYGFYDAVYNAQSETYDRVYTAEQMSTMFDGLINDGVYASIGTSFMVTPSSGMTVNVGAGRAWFNKRWTYNDAPIQVTLDASEASLDRIDAIVLQVDLANRVNSIEIVKGTPASTPAKPTLTEFQHPLAYITVIHQYTNITSSVIENAVGTSACPFVTGIIQTVQADQLFTQWNAQVMELIGYLEEEIVQVEQETGADLKPIIGTDITLETSAWGIYTPESGTEEASINDLGYTYRATIPLANVLSTMRPYVTWSLPTIDACGADILNQYQCIDGGVYAYADSQPSASVKVLTLECRKAVESE